MSRWVCESCGERFRLKIELVADLQDHVEDAYQELSLAEGQLEDLGIKTWELE